MNSIIDTKMFISSSVLRLVAGNTFLNLNTSSNSIGARLVTIKMFYGIAVLLIRFFTLGVNFIELSFKCFHITCFFKLSKLGNAWVQLSSIHSYVLEGFNI